MRKNLPFVCTSVCTPVDFLAGEENHGLQITRKQRRANKNRFFLNSYRVDNEF